MPGRRLTREQHRLRTRSRLLAAAARVFAAKGYGSASIDAIAAEAEVTSGAVYGHFKSKENLFRAAVEAVVPDPAPARVPASAGGVETQLRNQARRWLERVARDPSDLLLEVEARTHAARQPGGGRVSGGQPGGAPGAAINPLPGAVESLGVGLPAEAGAELELLIAALGKGLALARLTDPEAISPALYGTGVVLLVRGLLGSARGAADAVSRPGGRRRGRAL